MRLLSGSKNRVATVFHAPPQKTTKPQVRSGAYEKSAHHFTSLEKAPIGMIHTGREESVSSGKIRVTAQGQSPRCNANLVRRRMRHHVGRP